MEHKYYVYALIDPRNNKPFYIGKGCGIRCYKHLKETKDNTENRKKYAVIKHLQNNGYDVIVEKLFENLCETDAYDKEFELIKQYGRRDLDTGGILTNILEDNRPPRQRKQLTEEHKRNIGLANKKIMEDKKRLGIKIGHSFTDEQKKKMSEIQKQILHEPHSEETKQKIGDANRGKIKTKEWRDNLSKSHKGKSKNYDVWNKGLTKETDIRLKKRSEDHSKRMKEIWKLKKEQDNG